jgi:hypothetical protein
MGDSSETHHKTCAAVGPTCAAVEPLRPTCAAFGPGCAVCPPGERRPAGVHPHVAAACPPNSHPNYGSASPTLSSCTFGHNMGFTAVGQTRLPSKEPFPPHATIHTADRTSVI